METFWLIGHENDPTIQKDFIDSLTRGENNKDIEI
jgi:hypothetical protein